MSFHDKWLKLYKKKYIHVYLCFIYLLCHAKLEFDIINNVEKKILKLQTGFHYLRSWFSEIRNSMAFAIKWEKIKKKVR